MPAVLRDPLLHRTLANNFELPGDRRRGAESGRDPARSGSRSRCSPSGRCAEPRARARRRVERALAISRDRRVLAGSRSPRLVVVDRRRDPLRRHRLGQVHELRPRRRPRGLTEASSRGRIQFWEVALEGVRRKADPRPRRRHLPVRLGPAADARHDRTQQAHSLYLQALDELGIVGGLLALGTGAVLLWIGFTAWRAAGGRERELYAVLLGVSLAFAVGVAYDWFWQLAVVGSVFFMATGILVAARCGQLWRARAAARAREGAEVETDRRKPPLRPHDRRSGRSLADHARADRPAPGRPRDPRTRPPRRSEEPAEFESAVSHAETARSIEPWAATPYLQLGLLAQAQGEYPTGDPPLRAGDRPRGPQLDALLPAGQGASTRAGRTKPPRRTSNEAKRLNPLETCLSEGFEGCRMTRTPDTEKIAAERR